MKIMYQKIYQFATGFVQVFSLLLTALFLISGFLFTCYSTDMDTQQVLTKWDNPLLNVLGAGLLFLFFLGICHLVLRSPSKGKRLLLLAALGWSILLGVILIVFSKTAPAADAVSVYSIAERLAGGDTSVIHPTDSYLSYYPQQVGLVAFYEVIFRLVGLLPFSIHSYHIIKCINVALACVILFFQYKTVHLLWENDRTDCLYLMLAAANLPLIMYTSFVYGEIPSFALASMGIYFLLKLLRHPIWSWDTIFTAGCSLLGITLSVMLRKNSLIIVIAVILVVLLQWLHSRGTLLPVYALLCILCSLSILPLVQNIYEQRADNTLASGVPAMSYFAMGMQEASRGNGWYNGFNFYTYQGTGMNREKTVALSREAIAERLTHFESNPGYAADFYWQKYLSQWADGTYACRQATLATFGGRQPLFVSLYQGALSRYLIAYCNIYQNLLYLGAFLFCLHARKRKAGTVSTGLPQYLCLIGVIGGFLFHMLWEANSRYIFLYGLLLLPYAAQGLNALAGTCKRLISPNPQS